ncbi:hypothetical protein P175DRAFT_0203502 [Aspergillus ochraceoroseus IBT 24754]|uniref:Uncharacterized protein n=1 Tax=Aspergillus ochraceoroseus IBT 24754 TaxID=1392256 RepID=A0A2T5M011_9EURO|nr:uncharacterized protein P175DRAFT_0203502 [Aspergillus ochraceoroseus IBT 24754]PTU21868.1 hypothetical protein P175DRAFT_0203502 [Aspergillus ochraceoroseus IBT 24754]
MVDQMRGTIFSTCRYLVGLSLYDPPMKRLTAIANSNQLIGPWSFFLYRFSFFLFFFFPQVRQDVQTRCNPFGFNPREGRGYLNRQFTRPASVYRDDPEPLWLRIMSTRECQNEWNRRSFSSDN